MTDKACPHCGAPTPQARTRAQRCGACAAEGEAHNRALSSLRGRLWYAATPETRASLEAKLAEAEAAREAWLNKKAQPK